MDLPISNGSIGSWSLVEGRSDSKPRNYAANGYHPASGGDYITHWYTLRAYFQGAYPESYIEYGIQFFLKNFLIHIIAFNAAGPFGLLCRLGVKWETPLGGRFLLKRAIPGALPPPKRECCEGELLDCSVTTFLLMVASTVFLFILNHSSDKKHPQETVDFARNPVDASDSEFHGTQLITRPGTGTAKDFRVFLCSFKKWGSS